MTESAPDRWRGRVAPSYALAAALALSACDVSVAPIRVAEGCPDNPKPSAAAPGSDLIDDFEHEDLNLPNLRGRDGAWVVGWDMTSAQPQAESSGQCAARGRRAGHFVGGGFADWGANWTAVLRRDVGGQAVAFDASEHRKISFWAALGGQHMSTGRMPVGVTTMDVAWNGGVCTECMDYYRTSVSLTHSWQHFVVRFDELEQAGTGAPLVPLRREALVGFIAWPTGDFDIWLDDVRLEP